MKIQICPNRLDELTLLQDVGSPDLPAMKSQCDGFEIRFIDRLLFVDQRDAEQCMILLKEARARPATIGYVKHGPRRVVLTG